MRPIRPPIGCPPVSAGRPIALVTAPMRGEGFDLLRSFADVVYEPWIDQDPLRMYNAEQFAARVADEGATIVVAEADECAGPLFDQPLFAVASCRGDPKNVDVTAATAANVPVLRAPGRNADGVAEIAIALLLASTRGLCTADREVRAGEIYRDGTIPYQRFRAWQVQGKTAGLVGLGAVGRALRWRLEGLGMNVISYDPYSADATHTDLDALLAACDVVSLHAPVTPTTKGMIGAAQFAAMRDGAVFINTARAELHDHDALVGALSAGKVAAAGIDHFAGEWLDPDDPLTKLPNVVLAPHIGGATFDTEANHSLLIATDLARLLAGETPVNIVNPEVLGAVR